jgi:hypothetical protein
MTRETRLNVVFLVLFLAASVPGGVMLFLKKLDPAEAPMYLPKPVRKTLAAVDPTPAPPQVERVIGPVTVRWLDRASMLSAVQGGGATGERSRISPGDPLRASEVLTSVRRSFQLLRRGWNGDRLLIEAMIWDPSLFVAGPDENPYVTLDGPKIDASSGTVVSSEVVDVPLDVRRELQSLGFVDPPAKVRMMTVAFDSPPRPEDVEALVCSDPAESADQTDSVLLPNGWLAHPDPARLSHRR